MAKLILLLCVCAVPMMAQSHELDLSTGYNYQNSDQGNGVRANLNGWFAGLQYDLNDHVAVTVEADSYYGASQGQHASQQNYVAGPEFTFRSAKAKLRPTISVQIGDQRSSSAGIIDHSFDMQIGLGLQIKLRERVSLELTPAEYNLAIVSGSPTHSFSTMAALVWTLWKQK